MCLMMGFTRHEMVGKSLSECVNRTEPPRIGLPLDLVAGKSEYDQVWQFRRKDGSLFDAETLATKMPDGTRLGFVRDISLRKRKEARLRRLLDSNAQGVMFWNIAGKIESANDAFLGIVGYSREDLEAGLIDWAAMTPGEYADLDRTAIEELAATGVCTPIVKEYIRKDGSRVSVLESARRELEEANQRFAIATDCAGIGIWEFDVARQSLTWDDWMYRIYGHARGPDVEPYALWANSLHVDDRPRCEAQIGAAIRGEGEFDTEFRIVRPDGDVRHVKAVSRTSYGADGRALTMTGMNMDVTEQRRAEGATRAIR
jgi:PAS domain S-box-containing protein